MPFKAKTCDEDVLGLIDVDAIQNWESTDTFSVSLLGWNRMQAATRYRVEIA